MVHVTVNKYMTLKKINILEYAFGEGGGGHQKAYAVYALINVDNCERPLSIRGRSRQIRQKLYDCPVHDVLAVET